MSTEQEIQEYKRWLADGGHSHIVKFDFLNRDSWVWEVGYWQGGWVRKIAELYNPYIIAFEPNREWYLQGVREFAVNPKVKIYPFGLGSYSRLQKMGIDRDSTGMFCPNAIYDMPIESIVDFMRVNEINGVDLMQSNCEGGEYEIFPALIKNGLIDRFKYLVVQFHNLRGNHLIQRRAIQEELSKTHILKLCYDWVFEFWERK